MNWKVNVLFAALLMFAQSCQQQAEQETQKELSYAHPESIIEVDDLKNNLESYVLVDLRKSEEYTAGHLPNARQVWRSDITDTAYTYGGMMPSKEHLEKLLGSLGITPKDTVVIYDDKAECDAARLWWILKIYGHDHVKLLNGGLIAWKEAGEITTTGSAEIEQTVYHFSGTADSSIHTDMNVVAMLIEDAEKTVLLDTRSHGEFSGETHKNGAARGGNIPSSINLDWAVAVDFNGNHKFRSAKELKSTYEGIGIDSQTSIVTYCHSGVRSAHTLFVLTQLLGYENVRNYDGSWIEWSHLNSDTIRL